MGARARGGCCCDALPLRADAVSAPLQAPHGGAHTLLHAHAHAHAPGRAPVDYATYPLLDNRLVPSRAGSARLDVSYQGAANVSVAVSVEDTYLPTWPRAGPSNDTSAVLAANMSGPFTVVFRAEPSAGLDLAGAPPSPGDIEAAGGIALAADAARGPYFYAAAAANLAPGTNYTLLLAVRGGLSLSSGVTALSGLLVPDTVAPSFTGPRLLGEDSNSTDGSFRLSLSLGLDEAGAVSYAVYGDPDCITGARPRAGGLGAAGRAVAARGGWPTPHACCAKARAPR